MFTCWESQHDFLRVQSGAELCVLLFCTFNCSYIKVSIIVILLACSLFSSCTKQMYVVLRECCISYTFIHPMGSTHSMLISRNVFLGKLVVVFVSCLECSIRRHILLVQCKIKQQKFWMNIRKYVLILSSGSGTVS